MDKKFEISLSTKTEVHKTLMEPFPIYGGESWPTREKEFRQLMKIEMKNGRIVGKSRRDKIGNRNIRDGIGKFLIEGRLGRIEIKELQWFVCIVRMGENMKPRLKERPEGVRTRGRPKNTCVGGIEKMERGRLN